MFFECGYLVEKGKYIVFMLIGEELYDVLFDMVRFFDMIVFWYEQQKVIQVGECDMLLFVNELMEYIGVEVVNIKDNGFNMKIDMYFCLFCGKLL